MRSHVKNYLAVLAMFVFAAVVWASTRTDSTRYYVTQPTEIGHAQLKPGQYTIKANEQKDQLRVLRHGKVVATVPCHWVKLPRKAHNSEIFSTKDRVTRVEFQGRRKAVSVG
jgi:hypothetical protein